MSSLKNDLETSLHAALGDAVRFDAGHLAVYASDASNYRQVPIGVVVPKSMDEVVKAVAICQQFDVPILMRGGGTSQCGQAVNVAVVLDLSKHCNRIIAMDGAGQTATVEPGLVCNTLLLAAQPLGLTFAPDPSTRTRCTLGGMIANNSCGPHSVMAGKTLENVEALEILTYDGARFWVGPTTDQEFDAIVAAGGRQAEIYSALRTLRDRYADLIRQKFPTIKRRVSGINLDQLLPENGFNVARALVGTEGTCAVTLHAKLRLVHSPEHRVMLVLGFPDIYLAADAVPEYEPFKPIAIEGLDWNLIRGLQARDLCSEEIALLPQGNAWVVVEFGGDSQQDALDQAQRMAAYFASRPNASDKRPVPTSAVICAAAEQKKVWSIREIGASATQLSIDPAIGDPQVGWEDAAVDPHRLGDYLRAFQSLVDSNGYHTNLFGHFGDGCVHARITFDLRSAQGVAKWRNFTRDAAELVVAFGGSLSGEHGDGQAKAEFLPIMYGDEMMQAMRQFKRIWDPQDKLNPGKLISAQGQVNRMDDNLRLGPQYKVVKLTTKLNFSSPEGHGLQRAVERCVGMGKCRSEQGGTMCPSYRATKEERFSTRGRARLFWEMLQGEVIKDGWNSKEVKEALDTCLACKGCRSDCPTHTDMASYKAEFLSHYYETHQRPVQAFSMGRIGDWAPWAAKLPWLANFFTQTKGLSTVSRLIAGVSLDRHLPRLAAQNFRSLRMTSPELSKRPQVMLWVDTFSENFQPEVAVAAWKVLEHAGFQVVLPKKALCCGRPLYDFGLLDSARAKLSNVLDTLWPEFAADGAPIALVGLEPGCLSVFKDEMLKLFPNDPRALELSRHTFMFGDFLAQRNYMPPKMHADVLVHTHCHQKSLFGVAGDQQLLDRLGVNWQQLDSGCCGMAGSFGFHKDHAAMSMAIGEQVLFPAIRKQPESTYVVTNGFSCREQISQGVQRKAVHIAELLYEACQHQLQTKVSHESNHSLQSAQA